MSFFCRNFCGPFGCQSKGKMRCRWECNSRNCMLYLDRVLPIVTMALLVSMASLAFLVIYSAGLFFLIPYAVFVLFQVCANWYQIVVYSNFARIIKRCGFEFPGGPFFCDKCEIQQPVEVHHCWVCDRCVYRRDHHCFVLGVCVGAQNQAFFIFLLFHLALGCGIGAYHSAIFYESMYGYWQRGMYSDYIVFVKFYQLVFLNGNARTAMIALFFNTTLFFSISLTNFSIFQTFLVLRGQTQFEFLTGRKARAATYYEAWKTVFGPDWYLRLIFPYQSAYVLSSLDTRDFKTV